MPRFSDTTRLDLTGKQRALLSFFLKEHERDYSLGELQKALKSEDLKVSGAELDALSTRGWLEPTGERGERFRLDQSRLDLLQERLQAAEPDRAL